MNWGRGLNVATGESVKGTKTLYILTIQDVCYTFFKYIKFLIDR